MKNSLIAISLAVALITASGTALSDGSDHIEATDGTDYISSADSVIRTGIDTCLRAGTWSEDGQINACEGIEEPVAAPEPIPEPEAEPAPAPTPEPITATREPTIALTTLDGEALFATNAHELNTAGVDALTNLVERLGTFQEIESMAVTGHTDSSGSESYNQALSERRARTVAAFLGGAFPNVSISSAGAGELNPIDTNNTPEGRQANRRVDVEVTAKSITE